MTIEIEMLSKKYRKKDALKDVSISIPGGVYGLLGHNGAGKTTLLRILATLIPKTGGNVIINGVPIEKTKEIRGLIGYLPQEFSFYPGLNVYDTMVYFSALSDMTKNLKNRIMNLLEVVNLQDCTKVKVQNLSGGMKRRLGLAVAMISDPEVMLLDEPTAGLDPEERIRFRKLICGFAETKTVLFSTHIIDDIEATCGHTAILHHGCLIGDGSVAEMITEMEGKVWEMDVSADFDDEELSRYNGILISRVSSMGTDHIRFLSNDCKLEGAVNAHPKLEDAYVWKCRDNRDK